MSNVGYATLQIIPSAKGFGSALTGQTSSHFSTAGRTGGATMAKGFRGSFLPAVKSLAGPVAALFAVSKIKDFFGSAIDEAREAQKVGALTTQVIKSTGGAAGVTAKHVGALATAISRKAGIDDEAIQSGENLLLTFRDVHNEAGRGNAIFDRATRSAVDLSVAMGTDTRSAALQLGKALNDPVLGLTALRRSGVSFTKEQQDQIKAWVASGDTLKAQKAILAEVEKEFGGAAKAAATNGEKLSVAWGNLKERVGTALLPFLDRAEAALTSLINGGGRLAPVFHAISAAWDRLTGAFEGGGAASGVLSQIETVARTLGATFMSSVLPALQRFGAYLLATLVPALQQVWATFSQHVLPVLAQVATFIYGKVYPAIAAIVVAVAQRLRPVVDAAVASFRKNFLPTIVKVADKFREWLPTIERVISVVLKVVGVVLKLAATILGKVLPPLIRFTGFLMKTVVVVLATVIGWVVKFIGALLDIGGAIAKGIAAVGRFLSAVKDKVGAAVRFVAGLPGKVKAAVGDLGHLLFDAGKAVIQGFWDGMVDTWNKAKGFVSGIGGWISDHKGPIDYDRRLLIPHGRAVMEGFAKGIRDGFDDVKKAVADATKLIEDNGANEALDAIRKKNARYLSTRLDDALNASSVSTVKGAFDRLTSIVTDLGNDRAAAAKALHAANKKVADAEEALDKALAAPAKTKAEARARADRVAAARDSLREALSVQKTASSDLAFARANAAIAQTLHAQLADGERALESIARRRTALAEQIKAATSVLEEAQRQFDDYAKSVTDSVAATGALTAFMKSGTDDAGNAIVTSFQDIVSGLSGAVDQAEGFQTLIGQLTTAGLDQGLIDQVVQAGPQLGTAMANAILQGGADGVAQLNALNAQLKSVAQAIGLDQADALYGAGVQAAEGLLNGLKDKEDDLVAEARHIARLIEKTIRAALDIHSPSRVLRALGQMSGEGYRLGLADSADGIASTMATVVAPPSAPVIPAPSLGGSRGGESPMTSEDVLEALEAIREETAALRGEVRRLPDRHAQNIRTGAVKR